MGRRILYVAYFYPPSRDTGMLRSAAMVKYLRRRKRRCRRLKSNGVRIVDMI